MSGEAGWPFDDDGEAGTAEVSAPSPAPSPVVPRPGAVSAPPAPPSSEAAIRARTTELWSEAANPLTPEPRRKAALAERDALYRQLVGADEVVAQLGPKDAEPGDVPLPALPSGMSWDRSMIAEAQRAAAEIGLPVSIVRERLAALAPLAGTEELSRADAEGALRSAWGSSFTTRMQQAMLAMELLPPRISDYLEGLGNRPAVVKWVSELGAMLESRPGLVTAIRVRRARARLGDQDEEE